MANTIKNVKELDISKLLITDSPEIPSKDTEISSDRIREQLTEEHPSLPDYIIDALAENEEAQIEEASSFELPSEIAYDQETTNDLSTEELINEFEKPIWEENNEELLEKNNIENISEAEIEREIEYHDNQALSMLVKPRK